MLETMPGVGGARWDLVVLGEVNLDLVLRGDVEPNFGQREQLVDAAHLVLGGAGAITACGAARLGLRVAYCGLAGDDLMGRMAIEQIEAAGVDVSAVRVCAGEPSGIGVSLLREDGDRAILTFPGVISRFAVGDVPIDLLARARHVHVGAYFLQTGLHVGLAGLFAAHRRRGGTTSLDPNWDPSGGWRLGEVAAEVDLLLPNAREASLLTGHGDVEDAARRLAADGAAVAVKLGAVGALWHQNGHTTRSTGLPERETVDSTGAGDSFDAGAIVGLLEGAEPDQLLALANACGALSTRGMGGTSRQPTRAEALAALVPSTANDRGLT